MHRTVNQKSESLFEKYLAQLFAFISGSVSVCVCMLFWGNVLKVHTSHPTEVQERCSRYIVIWRDRLSRVYTCRAVVRE